MNHPIPLAQLMAPRQKRRQATLRLPVLGQSLQCRAPLDAPQFRDRHHNADIAKRPISIEDTLKMRICARQVTIASFKGNALARIAVEILLRHLPKKIATESRKQLLKN